MEWRTLVQALYGHPGEGNVGQSARESERADNRLLCLSPAIDSMFSTQEGESFVSQGERLWRLTEDSVAPGYPKKIAEELPGLPGENPAVTSSQLSVLKYLYFSPTGRCLHIFEWEIIFLQV